MNNRDILLNNMNFKDLNPLDAGWEKCKSGHSFGPYMRDYYLIHFVIDGKGVLYNESGEHIVKKNQIFIIKPHEITTYTADKQNPWEYVWIGFNGALSSFFDNIPSVFEYFENTFIEIMSCEKFIKTKEMYLTGKLFEIISVLSQNSTTNPNYEKLAFDYISSNYMRSVKIDSIAAQIGINREYLSRLFKNTYGMSMRQFLLETRLKHGAEFLKTGYTVAQSAGLCGYDDVFNFSKMFKKKHGISPNKYKKGML